MKSTPNIFAEIPCLTEQSSSFNALELNKVWFGNSNKRYLMQTLQKFITYNKSYFDFLNITPILEGDEQDIELRFKTTNYIGSIPLKAPNSGKQISDLLVVPRFSSNTNYTDLLDILDKIKCYIQPEFMEGLFLKSKISTAPPLSYEIIKFFNLLMKVVSFNWTKFIRKEVNSRDASGLINWNRYIIHLNDLQQ